MTAASIAINVTATATVKSGFCTFRGITVFSTLGATIVVYDNTSAAGTILAKFILGANGDKHIDIADGVRCDNGIHLTSTAAIEGSVRVG